MDKEEKEVTLEDLYWATLSKNDIIRILKDNCSKNIILEKQIADLEAKLAESEKLGKRMYEQKEYAEKILRMSTHEETKEICKLKQQLAEKDAEVQSWKDGTMVVKLGELEKQLAEKEKELGELADLNDKLTEDLVYNQNQTAIAELNNILDTFAIFVNEEKESMVSPDGNGNLSLLEYIENRIDALKGEK